jgi:hypothetical protein
MYALFVALQTSGIYSVSYYIHRSISRAAATTLAVILSHK